MHFSKKEIIYTSWEKTKENITLLLTTASLYFFAIIILIQLFSTMNPELSNPSSLNNFSFFQISGEKIIFIIAAILFGTGLNLGFVKICLNILKDKQAAPSQLIKSFDILIPYIFSTAIYFLINLVVAGPGMLILLFGISTNTHNIIYIIGILLITIPSLYISLRFQFYTYFLIDQKSGILSAILQSAKISKGYVYQLFILNIILSIIIQLSIIPYFLGLIIAIPYTKIVTTQIYLKLTKTY